MDKIKIANLRKRIPVGVAVNRKLMRDFRLYMLVGGMLQAVDAIPAQLNTNASRYQVSSVLSGERAETILGLIADMIDSKTVQIAYHANGHLLYYYTFLNEKTKRNYEIDFLLSSRNKICPIEVKSSGYSTHKSLDAFSEKYSDRILDKYLVYTKDLKKDADILMMPVYMLPFLK